MNDKNTFTLAIVAALGVAAYYLVKQMPGLLSGNNPLTQNATNADGRPVMAYQGGGVLGTAGAAANAASGGYLASIGEWFGRKASGLINPGYDNYDPNAGLNYANPAISPQMPAADQAAVAAAVAAGRDAYANSGDTFDSMSSPDYLPTP
jgi:hypothetical protein